VLVLFVFWLLSSYLGAYCLTHRLGGPRTEPLPALDWGSFETFRIATEDGEQLGAWYHAGPADALAGADQSTPVVLLLHGYGGSRSICLPQAELIVRGGCGVLLINLRAHGDSTGSIIDIGYSARKDVLAAVDWLERRHPGRPIIVWGRSLGSAAAIFAGADLGKRVAGYILECPYRDLYTATWNRCRLFLVPGVDVVAWAGLRLMAPLVIADAHRIVPLEAIAGIPDSVPILILAGGADQRATPAEAEALFERVKPHARLIVFPGADHVRLDTTDPERFRAVVVEFVRACRDTERAP
jgi:pimeloyl-ACP methyl ester carboxylesterase